MFRKLHRVTSKQKYTSQNGKVFYYQISKSSAHMIMRICVSSGFLPRSSGHFDPDGCSFHAAECGSHGLALPRSERSEATAASRYGGWRCLGEELSKYGHLDWTDFNLLWYTLEITQTLWFYWGSMLMGRPWDYMVMYRWFTLLKIVVFPIAMLNEMMVCATWAIKRGELENLISVGLSAGKVQMGQFSSHVRWLEAISYLSKSHGIQDWFSKGFFQPKKKTSFRLFSGSAESEIALRSQESLGSFVASEVSFHTVSLRRRFFEKPSVAGVAPRVAGVAGAVAEQIGAALPVTSTWDHSSLAKPGSARLPAPRSKGFF